MRKVVPPTSVIQKTTTWPICGRAIFVLKTFAVEISVIQGLDFRQKQLEIVFQTSKDSMYIRLSYLRLQGLDFVRNSWKSHFRLPETSYCV